MIWQGTWLGCYTRLLPVYKAGTGVDVQCEEPDQIHTHKIPLGRSYFYPLHRICSIL